MKSVAPFAGAWIEMPLNEIRKSQANVAPFAGAWIEIRKIKAAILPPLSLPSRERGLKFAKRKLRL